MNKLSVYVGIVFWNCWVMTCDAECLHNVREDETLKWQEESKT